MFCYRKELEKALLLKDSGKVFTIGMHLENVLL